MYHDLTLRDGSHALRHRLTLETIEKYCKFAEDAGIAVVEVGHGNGLGASSLSIGESLHTDIDMLRTARKHLKRTKLSVHIIPGVATIPRDIAPAVAVGVDIFRVASHCQEASMTKSHIEYLARREKYVLGVLMMSALCTPEELFLQASKMKMYGACGIVFMDSTGSFLPRDVSERVQCLCSLGIPIGFHGHNNLHLAVANSMAALEAGASFVDVTFRGFGAGAGNTPLEVMESLRPSGLDMNKVFDFCGSSPEFCAPTVAPLNLLTARYRLFSGFDKHILEASQQAGVSVPRLVEKLVENRLVAGQEDLIKVIAQSLSTFQKGSDP